MRTTWAAPILAAAALLAGCGGSSGPKTASISGTVTDVDGNPARGARVTSRDGGTTTSPTGAYVLRNVREDDLEIKAEIEQDGVTWRGRNLAITFQGERTANVNIVIAPESRLARIYGRVTDRNGNALVGASVFAYGGSLTSSRALSNSDGEYEIFDLVSGIVYDLNAGGRQYSSDEASATLRAGERRRVDFVLSDAGFGSLLAPENVGAVAWTSPAFGRGDRMGEAILAVKREFDPAYRQRSEGRSSSGGNPIEIVLIWDPVFSRNLLGYGVYRASSPNAPLEPLDFVREPLSGYYQDLDDGLLPRRTYYYGVTSLTTRFPDDPDETESDLSQVVGAQTLDDLRWVGIGQSPLLFRWSQGSGATEYVVFVYDRYPGVGVTSIWNNADHPATGDRFFYDGPALQTGRTYWAIVLGLANDLASRTISPVESFTYQP